MKNIKLHKIVLETDENGVFNNAVLMYKVIDDSGFTDNKVHSISFNSEVNIPILNGLINKAIKLAYEKENEHA